MKYEFIAIPDRVGYRNKESCPGSSPSCPGLIGPPKFLTFEEEDTRIPLIGHHKIRYGTPLSDLLNRHRSGSDRLKIR
jgi:hypothetical protein